LGMSSSLFMIMFYSNRLNGSSEKIPAAAQLQ